MAKDRRCLDDQSWEVAAMASAETVMAVYSDREDKGLESRMRSKDSCPVWGEGAGKVPDGNSPTPYSTACPVRGGGGWKSAHGVTRQPPTPPRGRFRARGRCPALPGRDARALGGVCADAASGQDPPDRVWPLRGGPARPARARQTGDLLLPGVHLHLRAIPPGHLPAPAEKSHRPHAGDPAEGQGRTAAAHASADPRPGALADAGGQRLLCLSCGANEPPCPHGHPRPCDRPVAALAAAAQPDRPAHMGADGEVGRCLAPPTAPPSPLAECTLRRQTPKVGAECPNWARSDLCGGRSVMGVPTAINAASSSNLRAFSVETRSSVSSQAG